VALANGTRLGPYQIVVPLGAGGMGKVYRAMDTRLGRAVAIKILPPHFADDPTRRQRFEREAKVVSSLNHPNICALLREIFVSDDLRWLRVHRLLSGVEPVRFRRRGMKEATPDLWANATPARQGPAGCDNSHAE
jgi:serine/threonine protein kinase